MQRSRDLLWDGLLNVRDLGGHPTEDGGETRTTRSSAQTASASSATRAGRRSSTTASRRSSTADERRARGRPAAELPVEVLHIPFFETDADDWKDVEAQLEAVTRSAADVPSATREVYLIFLEHFGRNVAAAIRAIARRARGRSRHPLRRRQGPHGLLTALLLHVAGVGTDEIAADYALSEERLRPRHEQWSRKQRPRKSSNG